MIVATGLAYAIVEIVYLQEAILFEPEKYTLPLSEIPRLLESLKIIDVFVVMAWTAEFSVKISLLFFFRVLVMRLRRLIIYVKCVIVFTVLVWIVLVCEPFILCPHFGMEILGKSSSYLRHFFLRTDT